ncbi:MAG: polysaccharide deacetylase family protein [Flavobacteriales bacterium]|nr:polysaccharide deacetylase family protein [Flavobacteriales bacterium]
MISIFSKHKNDRLCYVLEFCFDTKYEEWRLITDPDEWEKSEDDSKINYSDLPLESDLQIIPHSILFEKKIPNNLKLSVNPNEKGIRSLELDQIADPFAIIFFLLSRAEEYGAQDRDAHDRFKASNHSLVKLGLHKRPIADEIVKDLWLRLKLDYSLIQKQFQAVPSFDIDVAWAYKNRKFGRTIGSFIKSKNKKERIGVLLGRKKDPYDTYSVIHSIASRVDRIICFALLGDWSKYDKNIHWKNPHLGSLIRGLNAAGGMGIHPSYYAHLDSAQTGKEKERLEEIVGHEIRKSRQHFLRLKLPESYRLLLDNGLVRDYSMGFADNIGFRAGTSFPYHWFDLKANKKTDLLVFPFAYMDSALKDYLKLSPTEARLEVEELVENVQDVGGVFMFIWHNSSITDRDEWEGWKSLLDFTMSKIEE